MNGMVKALREKDLGEIEAIVEFVRETLTDAEAHYERACAENDVRLPYEK